MCEWLASGYDAAVTAWVVVVVVVVVVVLLLPGGGDDDDDGDDGTRASSPPSWHTCFAFDDINACCIPWQVTSDPTTKPELREDTCA